MPAQRARKSRAAERQPAMNGSPDSDRHQRSNRGHGTQIWRAWIDGHRHAASRLGRFVCTIATHRPRVRHTVTVQQCISVYDPDALRACTPAGTRPSALRGLGGHRRVQAVDLGGGDEVVRGDAPRIVAVAGMVVNRQVVGSAAADAKAGRSRSPLPRGIPTSR